MVRWVEALAKIEGCKIEGTLKKKKKKKNPKTVIGEFPGGPVVRTPHLQGTRFNPRLGN